MRRRAALDGRVWSSISLTLLAQQALVSCDHSARGHVRSILGNAGTRRRMVPTPALERARQTLSRARAKRAA